MPRRLNARAELRNLPGWIHAAQVKQKREYDQAPANNRNNDGKTPAPQAPASEMATISGP